MIIGGLLASTTSTIALASSSGHLSALVANDSGLTGTLTITPSGGVAPYTYAWTLGELAGIGTLTISSPAAASTTFAYGALDYVFDSVSTTATCTVTDAYGTTATINIFVVVSRTS